jgi:phosphonate transport system substrate-binding protein
MAGNAESTCRAIAEYLGAQLAIETRFVDGIPWQAREAMLDAGDIQLCWICGLPYVWKADAPDASIELCVVPVMRHARYENRPVYFSDVVVRRDSAFDSFSDLRGAAWAYNEPRSHSGYNVVRHHLAQLGETGGYFGSAIESGAHQASLRMIAGGEIDASAIDSTVLETELRRYPELEPQIRIVETLGPSPMPPWVMHRSVPAELRAAVTDVLLGMHADPHGAAILAQWGIAHFTAAADALYDPIRSMSREAQAVSLAR